MTHTYPAAQPRTNHPPCEYRLSFDRALTSSFQPAQPTHAAYRGSHELGFQAQQVGRDLSGEQYVQQWHQTGKAPLFFLREVQAEESCADLTPYRYLVQTAHYQGEVAFYTAQALYRWLKAYAVTLSPTHHSADFELRIGHPDDWQPLTLQRRSATRQLP